MTDRHGKRQGADRRTNKGKKDRQTERWVYKQRGRQIVRLAEKKQTDRQTDRQMVGQGKIQKEGYTEGYTDR
jgi:hypothetical protein